MRRVIWGNRGIFVAVSIAFLSLCLVTMFAFAEDTARHSPKMNKDGFSLGTLTFVRIPKGPQPLPHIKGGFADYDGPQSNFELPEFCMAKRELSITDLAQVRRELGIEGRRYENTLLLNDYDIAKLTNRLNRDFMPFDDGKPVNGRYCMTTAGLYIRALFQGARCERGMPKGCIFSEIQMPAMADRFSQDLNWSGEPQPGELTPTCSTGRRDHLIGCKDMSAWPPIEDKSWYLEVYARKSYSSIFVHGSPSCLHNSGVSVVLCFVINKTGGEE